jgi:hypothetical protein
MSVLDNRFGCPGQPVQKASPRSVYREATGDFQADPHRHVTSCCINLLISLDFVITGSGR